MGTVKSWIADSPEENKQIQDCKRLKTTVDAPGEQQVGIQGFFDF